MSAKAKKLLEEFQHLPANEQRWLKRQLAVADSAPEPSEPELERREAGESEPGEAQRRRAALQQWLAMAGTGHSEHTDVSENKNEYLAEAFATKP